MKPKKQVKTRGALGAAFGAAALGAVAAFDLVQKKNAVLRNYPVVGHARYLLNSIRPPDTAVFH